MEGNVNLRENPKKFFPRTIRRIKEVGEERVFAVEVKAKLEDLGPSKLQQLKDLVLLNPGTKPLILYFEGEEGIARMSLGKEFLVNPSPQLALKINDVLKANSVKLKVGYYGVPK
jgi:DNA polymerase-3 subunit alpha